MGGGTRELALALADLVNILVGGVFFRVFHLLSKNSDASCHYYRAPTF